MIIFKLINNQNETKNNKILEIVIKQVLKKIDYSYNLCYKFQKSSFEENCKMQNITEGLNKFEQSLITAAFELEKKVDYKTKIHIIDQSQDKIQTLDILLSINQLSNAGDDIDTTILGKAPFDSISLLKQIPKGIDRDFYHYSRNLTAKANPLLLCEYEHRRLELGINLYDFAKEKITNSNISITGCIYIEHSYIQYNNLDEAHNCLDIICTPKAAKFFSHHSYYSPRAFIMPGNFIRVTLPKEEESSIKIIKDVLSNI